MARQVGALRLAANMAFLEVTSGGKQRERFMVRTRTCTPAVHSARSAKRWRSKAVIVLLGAGRLAADASIPHGLSATAKSLMAIDPFLRPMGAR
jgi:hypothetical protein